MHSAHPHVCDQSYALRLQTTAEAPLALQGRIEHVLSGTCRDFDNANSLLDALAALQALATAARAAAPA